MSSDSKVAFLSNLVKEKDDVASDIEIVEKSEVKVRRRTRNDLERMKLAIRDWNVVDVVWFLRSYYDGEREREVKVWWVRERERKNDVLSGT